MVLIRAILLLLLASALAGMIASVPATAHKNHQKANAAGAVPASPDTSRPIPPSEMQQQMEAHAEAMAAAEPKTMPERLMSWFGRMHPFAVHFPIALFPVALVALVMARKRGETVELIRALIVVAGCGSAIAALLGWLNGGLTLVDSDTVLLLQRWLGSLLGLIGGAVGWWAWRRRDSVSSARMVAALGTIVALLLVQGFLGASVTHGMEHMMI